MHAKAAQPTRMVEWSSTGITRAAADGRYVRRFVGSTLAADTIQLNASSGSEVSLANPNGTVVARLPLDTLAAVLDSVDSIRGSRRIGVYAFGETPNLAAYRMNGSPQAPAAVPASAGIGNFAFFGWDGVSHRLSVSATAISREIFSPTAVGSLLRFQATDVGSATPKNIVTFQGGGSGVAEIVANQSTQRLIPSTVWQLRNPANTATIIEWNATGLGFFGSAPIAKPTVSGSRGGNAALASLLTQLAALGLITDTTTA